MRYKFMLRLWVLPLAFAIQACGPAPGTPLIRVTSTDGEGPLIAGCENVSRGDQSILFKTDRYLTTWGSASREGAAAGLYDGAQQGFRDLGLAAPDEDVRILAYGKLPDSKIFCRRFTASPHQIHPIVQDLLPNLGYPWAYQNALDGEFQTIYADRMHEAWVIKCPTWCNPTTPSGADHKSKTQSWSRITCSCADNLTLAEPQARWRDRFWIRVIPENKTESKVFVARDVFISRREKTVWSDYLKAQSVGYNEAVLLNKIDQALAANQTKPN